jgi:hypothetical protein
MFVNSPSYSIGQATSKEKPKEDVGPGKYENTSGDASLKYSISKSPRDTKPNSNPGPGQYEDNKKAILPNSPNHVVPLQPKPELFQTSKNPGPGNYDPSPKKSNGFAAVKSPKDTKIPISPGPGSYESKTIDVAPGACAGKAEKKFYITEKITEKVKNPGPGQYENKSLKTSNYGKFGKLPKFDPNRKNTPGPGHYNTDKRPNSASTMFTRDQRNTQSHFIKNQKNPGPGNYSEIAERKISSPVTMMTQTQREGVPKDKINSPSCVSYNTEVDKKGQRHAFGKEKKELKLVKNKEVPGPGQYSKPDTKKEGFLLRGKPANEKPNGVPGPGSYNEKPLNNSSLAFPKEQKNIDFAIKPSVAVPGPGQYDEHQNKKKGTLLRGKPADERPNGVPGPGAYNDKPLGNSSLAFPKEQKKIDFAIKSSVAVPGPGQYSEPDSKKEGFLLRGKPADEKPNGVPGPGYYGEKPLSNSSLAFPKEQKKIDFAIKPMVPVPGPGQYDEPQNKKQGVLLRGKPADERTNGVPGPGSYEHPKLWTESDK